MQPSNRDRTPLESRRDNTPGELAPLCDPAAGTQYRRGRLLRELVRINRAIARTRRRMAQIENRVAVLRQGRQQAA